MPLLDIIENQIETKTIKKGKMTGLNPDRASPSVGMLWQLEREALSIIKGRINASESIR